MSEKQPIERIAADILIAALGQSNSGLALDPKLQDKSEKQAEMIGSAFRIIHRAVKEASEENSTSPASR